MKQLNRISFLSIVSNRITVILAFFWCGWPFTQYAPTHVLALQLQQQYYPTTYNYFGYGSNMKTTTMTVLRGLTPLSITAAVLPEYKLRFNLPGLPGIEPSSANVEPSNDDDVHGVCYTLTPDDFAQVGRTEGVPLAYRWQPVQIVPYNGNGKAAGQEACRDAAIRTNAYTLVATFPYPNDIAPSKSYLRLIQQGAEEWNMDREYRAKLEQTAYDKRLIIPDGIAESTLQWAELQKKLFEKW